jgi:hypothetical protein
LIFNFISFKGLLKGKPFLFETQRLGWHYSFMRRINFKTVAINIIIFIGLAAAVEVFFIFNKKEHWLKPQNLYRQRTYRPTNLLFNQYKLNLKEASKIPWTYPLPDAFSLSNLTPDDLDYSNKYGAPFEIENLHFIDGQGEVKIKGTQETLYKAQFNYTGDSDHLNSFRNSDYKNPSAKKFILQMGDSYIFGEGVEQKYTLPSQLNQMLPNYNSYNFGLPGSSTNDFLYRIQKNKDHRYKWVKEDEGILIFHFLNFHMNRVICGMRCYGPRQKYILAKAEYKVVDNKPILVHEHFFERQPLSFFYSLLAKSETLNFFNIDFPTEFSREDFKILMSTLSAVFDYYSEHLHVTDRYIALHPYIEPDKVMLIKELAEPLHIKVLDYSYVRMNDLLANRSEIPIDHHPTAHYNNVMAQMISQDLKRTQ